MAVSTMVVPLSSKKPRQFPGGLSHPEGAPVRRGAAEAERMPQPAAVGEIYENGKMTALKKGAILEVPYIHFMNWKPGRNISQRCMRSHFGMELI